MGPNGQSNYIAQIPTFNMFMYVAILILKNLVHLQLVRPRTF